MGRAFRHRRACAGVAVGMKVLLTGASGFLGQHVVQLLQQQGIATVAIGRRRPLTLAPAQFHQVDLLDLRELAQVLGACGATHLLHLAWVTDHGTYWESPHNLRWVDASLRLVEAFAAAGGRHVVVAGSCAEYDWSGDGVCVEDTTPLRPATLYGVSKDKTRQLLLGCAARCKLGFAWGRVFFPFGAGEDACRLLPSLVAALQGHVPPFGVSPRARRDFLHVADVASALLVLLQAQVTGAYNISSGVATPIFDVVRLVAGQLGADADTILRLPSARTDGPELLLGNNERLCALGWQPRDDLAAALRHAVAQLAAAEPVQPYAH